MEEFKEELVILNTVKLSNELRLEGLNEDDVELLQFHGENFINDELQELAEHHSLSESTALMHKGNTNKRSTEFISDSITMNMQTTDQFIDNNYDYEQSLKAKEGVLEMISCYQEQFYV